MIIYLVFLLIPLAMSFNYSHTKKNPKLGVWLYFIPLVIFTGLRDDIGPDWSGYQYIYDHYENYQTLSVVDIFQFSEFGFFLINKFSDSLGFGLHGVMFFCSLVFLWGVFSFALKTANPWLGIAIVMPYLIFVISMSGARQATAMGFGFYLLSRWNNSSILLKVFWILLAVSFHNSAAILLFLVLFTIKVRRIWKVIMATFLFLFLIIGLNQMEVYEKYRSVYIEQNVVSGGAFFHVLLSAFPAALYLWYRRKISKIVEINPAVDIAAFMSLAALPLVFISSTGVDRLALYFSFIQMWVYGALIQTFPVNKNVWKIFACMLTLSIFLVYFIFGTHAYAYIPYKNVIFTW